MKKNKDLAVLEVLQEIYDIEVHNVQGIYVICFKKKATNSERYVRITKEQYDKIVEAKQ